MTTGSHELALTIINDGAGYKERLEIAKVSAMQGSALMAQISASHWLRAATEGARVYERQFGTPATASSFTPEDILLAAAELADYYETHRKENEDSAQEERSHYDDGPSRFEDSPRYRADMIAAGRGRLLR